ncbi:MAG: PqqD family protein [Acidimicrobiales bacterium]
MRPSLHDHTITVPAHVLVRELDDEMVILSLQSEEYFGLDPVGARIWQLLASEATVQDAFDTMLREFEVDDTTLASDLDRLIHELSSRHLIEVVDPSEPGRRP